MPFPYFYDVATWSYSLLRGLAGNGFLTSQHAVGRGDDAVADAAAADRDRVRPARCTRSTATRCRRSAWSIDLMNAGATVYRAQGRRSTSAAATSTPAPCWSTGPRSRSPTSRRWRGARDTAGPRVCRASRSRPLRDRQAEDRASGPARTTSCRTRRTAPACTNASDYCWVRFTLQEKDRIPAAQLDRADVDADQRRGAQRPGERVHRDHHPAPVQRSPRPTRSPGDIRDVRQQRRAVPELLHAAAPRAPATPVSRSLNTEPLRDRTGRRLDVITPGSTYDGDVRHRQPARVGLRQGRVPLPRPGGQQRDLRPGIADGGTGTGNTTVPAATAPIRYKVGAQELRLRAEQRRDGQARRAPGRGRPAVRRRAARSCSPATRSSGPGTSRSSGQSLNALLYPMGACSRDPAPAGGAPAPVEQQRGRRGGQGRVPRGARAAGEPISAKELPQLVNRPVALRTAPATTSGSRSPVRRQGAAPGRRPAKLPKAITKQVRYVTRAGRASRSSSRACARSSTSTSASECVAPIMRDLDRATRCKPIAGSQL